MKKLLIAIALLSVCVFNAKADKHEEQEITQPTPQNNASGRDITYDKWCDLKKNKIPDLQKRIDWYKEQAAAKVDTLITCCEDTTSLDKFDTENAKQAIKTYEEGAGIVAIINPRPEFDAEAAIPALKKRIEVAGSVQKAYVMLKRKYSSKENDDVYNELINMSKDKFLTEPERILCEDAYQTLAADELLRGNFAEFLKKWAEKYSCIPTEQAAVQARDELIKDFVNIDFEGDNVPETFALLHDIIKRITSTLTNYTGSYADNAKFKRWIDNFLDQLSTE